MKFWSFRNNATTGAGELYLYGPIDSVSWWGDEITPAQFQSDLSALGNVSQIDVYINSDGGDVFAGQAILSMLKRHPANVTVHVDGLAASIASVIAMAGDQVLMPRNAMMMVHNPWTFCIGNSDDLRKMADDLDQIRESLVAAYQDKTGMDRDELIELLNAETWLTADEAVQYGFADEIEQSKQVAASVRNGRFVINGQEMDLSRYQNVPKRIAAAPVPPLERIEEDPDGEYDIASLFTVGNDVQITIPPRVPGQSTGDVREVVLTYAYGILFDGMEDDGIYHWYLESELAPYVDPDDNPNARRRNSRTFSIRDGVVPPDVSEAVAPKDTPWTKPTLGDFTDKQWTDLTDDEKNHIAGHYAWAREMPPMVFADLKFPHHRPSDGAVVWNGVVAAAARLPETNIPEADVPKVQAELGNHYKQFGETPPWEQEDNSKGSGSQRPNGSLSFYERRIKNNERRLVK